jgi:two-component system phosphate regulon sensor histidine kinase PhoR
VLVIGSKILNKLVSNIKSASKISRVIIYVILSFYLIQITLFNYNWQEKIFLFLLFSCLYVILLSIYGHYRQVEINKVIKIIKSIQENALQTSDEIQLGKDLSDLEKEIKSMFLRTQNDISNMKKLEQVRTEFLGNVSHELRTPIFTIQGYLETLFDGALNDENVNRTFLQKAIQHTYNLNNLLNDLIDISMIESGQMKMSFRYFKVFEFLEMIVSELKPAAVRKDLEFNLIPFDNSLQLFGDKQRLKQVITNLATNAIKYTETGKIELGITEGANWGRIFIRDTGIGIAGKDIDRIFERFYRVDKDRSREMGGTGLGLAIVKHIIEAHDSRIEVESEQGKGSEFSFQLKK